MGDDLALGLTKLVSGSLTRPAVLTADRAAVVVEVRGLIVGLGWPLGPILLGFVAGALAAHQLQVRGLWATGLLVPDLSRLWAISSGPGLAVRAERAGWSMVKAAVVVVASPGRSARAGPTVLRLGGLRRTGAGARCRPGGAPACLGAGRGSCGAGTGRLWATVPAVRVDAAHDDPRATRRSARD